MYTFVTTSDGQSVLRGVMLKVVAESFIENLKANALLINHEIARQLDSVFLPCQKLSGRSDNFSFMAFPIPLLTLVERQSMNLVDCLTIACNFNGGSVKIACEDFGEINWFYIKGMPEVFDELLQYTDCIGCEKPSVSR